jgi:hypothetical protein
MRKLVLALGLFVLADHSFAASYLSRDGVAPAQSYAQVSTDRSTILRGRRHHRYWKPGDLWPRSRGLMDRNAPGCPYESC